MGRNVSRTVAVCLWMLVFSCIPVRALDVILDPAEVNKMLAEIGKFYTDTKSAPRLEDQLDALYEMGERCLDLADLMSKDRQSHGAVDASLAAVIDRRLKAYGINVLPDPLGYHYDLAAFREYLRRAPKGKRAADAKYALIGFDEPGDSVPGLLKSIADKDAFIREYPNYSEMSLVKFLLAQQHVQLARVYTKQKNATSSGHERKAAEDLYRQIVKQFPKSPEAEAAADYLAQTASQK